MKLLCMVLMCLCISVQAERIQVIILSGQSNSDGRAESSEIPKDVLEKCKEVLFYHGNASGNAHSSCPPNQLMPLIPGSGSLTKGANHFGVEMGLGAALTEMYPNQKFCIIKYAKGGSSLFADWDLQKGQHLPKLRDTVENGLKTLKEKGHTPEIVAFLWHQGESDSTKDRAPKYEEKLDLFLKQIRHDFNSTLAIAIGQINTDQKIEKEPAEQVIAAQIKIASTINNAVSVPSKGLKLKGDKLHFNSEGQLGLGQRYADELKPYFKAKEVIKLWPNNVAPNNWAQDGHEQIVRTDGVTRINHVSTPTITFFPAINSKGKAMVICPGGGYSKLAYDKEGEEIADWLNKRGINAFVLKYRLPKKDDIRHLPALQDAQRAVSILRSKAKELGINPDQIGIMGFSAGGHLSALTSTAKERSYTPIDEVDKHSCKPNFTALIYPAYILQKDKKTLDELLSIDKNTPTAFLVHAKDDHIPYMNSVVYGDTLKKAGVNSNINIYENGGHGFGLRINQKASDQWPLKFDEWLQSLK